jgi:acyl carrier protein
MTDREKLMRMFQALVLEITGKPLPDVAPDASIADLGVDSVSVAEIVARIEDDLGIEVPAARWMRVKTVAELFDAVEEAPRKPG